MRIFLTVCAALIFPALGTAELTRDQKIADLTQLAGLYAKNYGPYEWKRDTQGFDLLNNLQPWLDRAAKTKSDLEFMDLLVEYVAGLNDAHDNISFPSTFSARLGLAVDIYDGKVLIDNVDRNRLPAAKYPFVVGDELVSVDGKPVADLLKEFQKYSIAANPRSTARLTANFLVNRYQQIMPLIADLGESATVVINRAGGEETYNLPWIKTGTPIREAGPVVSPKTQQGVNSAGASDVYWDDSVPSWMFPVMPLLNAKIPTENRGVLNFGSRTPIFALPTNFVRRLGGTSSDVFYSGTFAYDGLRIGFIRIPDFSPTSATAALQQFEAEIRFFQQNTDGLIVDVMRNPGGSVAYDEALLQRLIPYNFRTLGFEIRATSSWLYSFIAQYENAKLLGAPDWVQTFLAMNLDTVAKANSELRGRTGPVSLNSTGSLVLLPANVVYTKPLMVLADEMSASGGDAFPAVIQDNKRGPIFGYRTMGAGGNVAAFDTATFTEGVANVTLSLMNRIAPVVTSDYPEAPYVENIGVRPDIAEDYMTRDNLMNRGRTFVENFSKAIASHIRESQQ